MLITLGPRSQPDDLVGLLLECHHRIRTFVRLAEEVGRRVALRKSEVVDACERCARYFREAMPLHVEDEEQSVSPRLRGLREEVDGALDTMHAQHGEHEPLVRELLAALEDVRGAPGEPEGRARLRSRAAALAAQLEPHLYAEEHVLFPAVRSLLTPEVQAEIVLELRARRALRGPG